MPLQIGQKLTLKDLDLVTEEDLDSAAMAGLTFEVRLEDCLAMHLNNPQDVLDAVHLSDSRISKNPILGRFPVIGAEMLRGKMELCVESSWGHSEGEDRVWATVVTVVGL